MANGDDGYADTGGGGSVWCDFQISEVDIDKGPEPKLKVFQADGSGHRPRKKKHEAYRLAMSHVMDKFTELKGGDKIKGRDEPLEDGDDLITKQGKGYFVLIVDKATQIERVEIEGETLRIYLPIVNPVPAPPPGKRVRQASLRWGLRDPKLLGNSMWASLKAALLKTPGVADVTLGGSIEKYSSVAGSSS